MSHSAFEQIAATIDAPMVIVTSASGPDADGCLVGFSTQCSIEPLRYLVCLSKANRTFEVAQEAESLVVHMLHGDPHDRKLARLFGEETGRDVDKLCQCAWEAGPAEAPVLTGCDWFAGSIVDRVDLGDHVGFVLEVADGDASRTDEPYLGFGDVRSLEAGNPS